MRRKAQLIARKPGLNIVDLRGNIDTRMGKVLETGELDAAILACAGLERIGRGDAITEVIAPDVMLSAPGQGALGIQTRCDDAELLEVMAEIHDAAAAAETTAERALLAALGGGCQVPIGALGRVEGGKLTLRACVCSLDGATVLRAEASGASEDAASLGRDAAESLLADGADAIVAELA